MISARSVCMTVSRASGAGLCGVGNILWEVNERLVKIYENRTFVFTDKWVNFINHLHNLTRADCNL